MATRAILTAFSTASAPELNSADFFAWSPGVSSASASHTSTYPAYGVTMKQVWVKAATWSVTALTTAGAALPTETTAMPGTEVDQRVAVGVDDHAATGRLDEHGKRRADPVGDSSLLAGQQLGRARAGDFGDEAAFLREGRPAGEGLGSWRDNVGNP